MMTNYKRNTDPHLYALADISEVFALLAGSSDIKAFLRRAVEMVANHLDSSVASVYLFDEEAKELVLKATVGLSEDSVDAVRMSADEGLVGKAFRELRPIREADASQSPHFKYFPEAHEEPFGSFAAVPIQRGVEKIGVLTAQRPTGVAFKESEILLLQALTSQLAVAIENARVLLSISDSDPGPHTSSELPLPSLIPGQSASSGWALGKASPRGRQGFSDERREPSGDINAEKTKLKSAIDSTIAQIEHMHEVLEARIPEVASLIFGAHLMMLKDAGFTGKMNTLIEQGSSASSAVISVARNYMSLFEKSSHDYMKEKGSDVKDLAVRILGNLNDSTASPEPVNTGRIMVAEELLPSDILKLAIEEIGGIILLGGGITSHVAILARSLEIPLVILDSPEAENIPEGTRVLVDADIGNVYIDPGDEVISKFKTHLDTKERYIKASHRMRKHTRTKDGERVKLLANINLLSELETALTLKAEGVGLYRSEFPFLVRQSLPTEEEQVRIYARLFRKMAGLPVTVRTLDVGGDKALAYFDQSGEPNPELGLRSLRFSLRHEETFREQLRAILRASGNSDIGIMFPMVGSLDELRKAKEILNDCSKELGLAKAPKQIRTGMMIELPSVIEIIDDLIEESDFFSIGTNDFVQYICAADRTNEAVAEFYKPWDPGVLRALARVVRPIVSAGKPVSVCGEMAHDKRFVPFFLGLGIRALSLDPRCLSEIQKLIQGLEVGSTESYTESLLKPASAAETKKLLLSD